MTIKSGFTLIELLVVIGLVALLVGGIGISLHDRGGTSVRSAQQTLAAICGTARAQAALHQTEARVLCYADRPPDGNTEKYLRLLQIYRAEPAGSNTWIAAGPPSYLPRGVCVVPPDTAGLIAPGVEWPVQPPLVSTFGVAEAPQVPANTEFAHASRVFFLEFRADGTPTPVENQSFLRVVVASANVAANLPQFGNPSAARGLVIRANGSTTFVNDAGGF